MSGVVDAAFWRGRRVFLTGHTGFKGGWLSLWLQSLGAEVHGYSLAPPTAPSLFELAGVGQGMASDRSGDLRDQAALQAAVAAVRPEIVLHLAAQALVREGYRDPVGTYATNVMGTLHLLEAVRQTGGVRAVLVVTTDKVYRNREWLWAYREDEALGGHDPYSSSKACSDLLSESFAASYFPPEGHGRHGCALATARAGNVIGGGDFAPDRLLPDVLAAWSRGEAVVLRHPGAVRPWQHVLEPLAGYLRLAQRLVEQPGPVRAWNFGPDEADMRPVAEVLERCAALWPGAPGYRVEASEFHEAGLLKLDSSRARHELGWRPRWSLEEALRRSLDWHQAWRHGEAMREFCLVQLAAYQEGS